MNDAVEIIQSRSCSFELCSESTYVRGTKIEHRVYFFSHVVQIVRMLLKYILLVLRLSPHHLDRLFTFDHSMDFDLIFNGMISVR